MKKHIHQINVITHRGLEPSNPHFFPESSYQAFVSHIRRGFGIEMDFYVTQDNQIVLWHDIQLPKKDYCFLRDLTDELLHSHAPYHALHIKHRFQNQHDVDILLSFLLANPSLLPKLLLFDVKPDTARFLKSQIPTIQLAASVSHPYDIQRFSQAVGNTLMSMDEFEQYGDLYSWAWLDEWDLKTNSGQQKYFYAPDIFIRLRNTFHKIAVVSPELHGTSPSLLGGEQHESSANKTILFSRIQDILKLVPDIICTDYPEEVKKLL